MIEYNDGDFPEAELPVLPTELGELVREHILQGAAPLFEVRGGHVYDRKGWLSIDSFGAERNRSYGRDSDDVIFSLTIRIPSTDAKHLLAEAQRINEAEKKAKIARELAELDLALSPLLKRKEELEKKLGNSEIA